MNRTTFALFAILGVSAAGPALAQTRPASCPEGRTASGACVKPQLAAMARQQAVCYSQYKLSYIACPGVTPAKDVDLKFPFNVVGDRVLEFNSIFRF